MPSDLLSPSPWLAVLRDALPDAGTDPESVHRLRVASRRLDVWLRLAGRARLRDDLRWLRRAAGPVRDLDVLVAREWPAREARRLRTLRANARRALREALGDARLVGTLQALSLLPPIDPDAAREALPALARAARSLHPDAADLAGLHRLRRAVRRVRHALEWLGEPHGLDPVQDALGELGDLALAVRLLGPDAVSADLLAQRAHNALTTWREARPLLTPWC